MPVNQNRRHVLAGLTATGLAGLIDKAAAQTQSSRTPRRTPWPTTPQSARFK